MTFQPVILIFSLSSTVHGKFFQYYNKNNQSINLQFVDIELKTSLKWMHKRMSNLYNKISKIQWPNWPNNKSVFSNKILAKIMTSRQQPMYKSNKNIINQRFMTRLFNFVSKQGIELILMDIFSLHCLLNSLVYFLFFYCFRFSTNALYWRILTS